MHVGFLSLLRNLLQSTQQYAHWDGILTLTDLVVTDRDGKSEGHLQVFQRLLPVFIMSGSTKSI